MRWTILVIMIFAASAVQGAKLGLIAEIEGETITQCIEVDNNLDGYNVLEQSDFEATWSEESSFGHALCKLNGVGEEVSGTFCEFTSGKYWEFNILLDGWEPMPVGYDAPGGCWNRDLASWDGHYCAEDGDVLGWVFADSSAEPPATSYEDICPDILQIDEIEVEVDGDDERSADEFGGEIEVRPGSFIEMTITLENTGDVDLEDVEVEAIIYDIDDGDDIDDEDEVDIDPGEDEEVELEFSLPMELEDERFDMILTLQGEDEDGLSYFRRVDFTVDVEKERHEILIEEFYADDETPECGDRITVYASLLNIGEDEEDVTVILEGMGVKREEDIIMSEDPDDRDNRHDRRYTIQVPGSPGQFALNLRAEYGNDIDSEDLLIDVSCDLPAEEPEDRPEDEPRTILISEINPPRIVEEKEESWLDENLATLITVLLVIIVLLVVTSGAIAVANR